MGLESYFSRIIEKVESTDVIKNDGKDKNGFYLPTRKLVLRHLGLLRDLHAKPLARAQVKDAWAFVVENVPPEWLVLSEAEKAELSAILKG